MALTVVKIKVEKGSGLVAFRTYNTEKGNILEVFRTNNSLQQIDGFSERYIIDMTEEEYHKELRQGIKEKSNSEIVNKLCTNPEWNERESDRNKNENAERQDNSSERESKG